jgi:phosphate transport system protein
MRHFDTQLDDLRKRLLEMSGLVESGIYRSILSLTEKDEQQAMLALQNEARINQMEIEIDDLATGLLALEQPVASDLRFITAAIKINNDLERMGDHAVNIAERSLNLIHEPLVKPLVDIPQMANLVESMVRKALDAFVKRDPELARDVMVSDEAVDIMRDSIYRELTSFMEKEPSTIRQCLDLMFVARNLERIADHSTNIAEDVVFLVEGIDVRHHSEAAKEPAGNP